MMREKIGCWFTSDKLRLLINFIPRWLIVIAILALYARVYFVIHKVHTEVTSFDDGDGSPRVGDRSGSNQAVSINMSRNVNEECQRDGAVPSYVRRGRSETPVLKRVR